ncbi:hypothetical protein QT972_09900 [Microcoleus sp. herbarium7]|uniref:hypothetical protein n=1 Tax=Microcoleus sp. herbarium7 TaxID=3055435 RepID=UPI002FD2EE7B
MKYQGFLVLSSSFIVTNFLATLIKAAVTPYHLWAIAVLFGLVCTLIFGIRDPGTVSDIIHVPTSEIKVCAFLSLVVAIATASIVAVS